VTLLIPIRDDNPYRRFPFVTLALIAANVLVFLRAGASPATVFHFGAIPCDVIGRCVRMSADLRASFPGRSPAVSLFTSMFIHGSIAHLVGNMLYLWVFGNNVEDRLGHVRYTLFYFVCGLAAAFAHIAVSGASQIPVVGASGAISGVLGAYLVLWPRARVLSILPAIVLIPVEVSARFLLGMWFVMQLLLALAGVGASRGSGVAFFAHVGGFVAGYVLIRILAPRQRSGDRLHSRFHSDRD
jgi:membrane associated rhomboid family serine protease